MTEYVVGELEEARFRQCNGDGQDSRNTLRDAKASNSVARVQMGNIFFYYFMCFVLAVLSLHQSSLQWMGFSLRWLLLLWSTGSRVHRIQQCGSWALENQLWYTGLVGSWCVGLSGSGIKLMSPALAGGFFTTAPPGKPQIRNI